jgi:hypothetical protein
VWAVGSVAGPAGHRGVQTTDEAPEAEAAAETAPPQMHTMPTAIPSAAAVLAQLKLSGLSLVVDVPPVRPLLYLYTLPAGKHATALLFTPGFHSWWCLLLIS